MSQNISYEALLNALPEIAFILDSNANIIAINEAASQLLGISKTEITGKALEQVYSDTYDLFLSLQDKSKNTADVMQFGRFFEAKLSTLSSDETGDKYLLLFHDTTVHKLTEQALLVHEQRYRTLFENSNDAILILDLDLSILIANEQAARFLQEDLSHLLQYNIIRYLHRGEHNLFNQYIERLLNGEIIPSIFEATLLDTDSQPITVEISLTLVRESESKQPLHIQMIARDIRERRANQELMRARIEQLVILRKVDEEISSSLDINRVLKVSLDAAMRLSRADAAFIAITEEEQIRVSHVAGLYPESVIGANLAYHIGITGRVIESHEAEFIIDVKSDPSYYEDIENTQALMAFPLISQDRLLGILNLETTERHRFNESIFDFIQILASRIAVALENARLYEFVRKQLNELSGLYEELKNAERLKTDMMRIANHDLKNPLSIVRGYVDLLEIDKAQIPSDFHDYLQTMRQSLERADQILHDFLSAEAVTARTTGESMQIFDLMDLLSKLGTEYNDAIKSKRLKFEQDLPENGLAMLKADKEQIYEALSNLMSNAIKYTPEKGKISLSLNLSEYKELELKIQDTGYGIPEEKQEKLFEPFYRAMSKETANIEGTGLGLHLVKNIIERHGGEIIFESIYQKGSVFGFRLPLSTE